MAFTFVDLFCGVGGFHVALKALDGRCVFSNDINKFSRQTYFAWHGDTPVGLDFRECMDLIPDHDVLAGGFPCQPFSLSGIGTKRNLGKPFGVEDKVSGTLFLDVMEVVRRRRPKGLILENVPSLAGHDGGKVIGEIERILADLGYQGANGNVNAKHWVPQSRNRRYFVYVLKDFYSTNIDERFKQLPGTPQRVLGDILEAKWHPRYRISDKLWQWHQQHREKMNKRHGYKSPTNGFGYSICRPDEVTNTLSARYGKDGSEILVEVGDGGNPRKLTPRECARLMGYSDELPIPVSDTQFYRQMGNSVVPPVIQWLAEPMISCIQKGS